MLPTPLMRCTTLSKPGVGVVHLHRAVWRPGRIREMWFQPEGRSLMHPVPEAVWDEAFRAETVEQMMALARSDRTVPSR